MIFDSDSEEMRDALCGCVCVFGVFDGLHEGHMSIVKSAFDDAERRGVKTCAITFDRDPDEAMGKRGFKKISTDEDRIAMLRNAGFDNIAVLDFCAIANMGAESFLDSLFAENVPASLHVGEDIRFGKGAHGDASLLKEWGDAHGMRVNLHSLKLADGAPVSSTRVRKLLEEGDIVNANRLLGHPYRISGIVERGRGQGADMGFATANISIPLQTLALGEGVYAGVAYVDGKPFKAAMSVGVSPTFKDRATADVEVHILGFEGNLYGCPIEVDVLEYLRPMMAFDSKEELIETVMGNIKWVEENIILP